MAHAVYVIESETGPVKIGISHRPTERLEALQRATKAKLRLVHSVRPDGLSAFAVERAA